MTRPSGSVVALGYQRRCDMGGTDVQVPDTGSKTAASADPSTPLRLSCPPTTNMRPSGSWACPLQKRLYGAGTGVRTPVSGSQTVAELPPAPSPRYISTTWCSCIPGRC
jgi:hypothetical protein